MMFWEPIDPLQYESRARVPGGWIVKVREDVMHHDSEYGTGYDWRVAICFVPDPGHTWELEGEG